MLSTDDPIGPDNDRYLHDAIADASFIMCAWGNGPFKIRQKQMHLDRVSVVMNMINATGKQPHMLDLTKFGMPRHPLYFSLYALAKPFIWER